MTVLPTKSIPTTVQPQVEKTEPVRLATYYVIIDGTHGPIKLRPLTFYHNIFEMAYMVHGLPPWHASEDKVQAMKEALDRLNTLGRFEIFAYPDELDQFLEAVPEELKEQAKEMAGI
jgi:hypothetical protein